MYPVLNELIILEKKQPTYSDYYLNINNTKYRFSVNRTASDILRLCTGEHSIEEIINILTDKYNEKRETVSQFVSEFVNNSINYGHIIPNDKKISPKELLSIGSCKYWSLDLVSLELTYCCPLKCKHCYASAGKGSFISYETVENLLKECEEMGVANIQLTGGEPLLHPDFFKMVNSSLSKGLKVSIFTSGYVSNDKIWKEIESLPVDKVSFQISVDGLEEYHNNFRGVKDAFDKTCRFIKKICDMGFSVTTATCFSEQSYDELYELATLMKEMGVRLMRLSPIANKGRAHENNIMKNIELARNSRMITKKLSEELGSEAFRVLYFEEGEEHIDFRYKKNCGLGQNVIRISPNGDVFPCLMTSIKYANISEMSLLEIQKKYSNIWGDLFSPTNEVCGACNKDIICSQCVSEGIETCDLKGCAFLESYNTLVKRLNEVNHGS